MYKAFYLAYSIVAGLLNIQVYLVDSAGLVNGGAVVPLSVGYTDTAAQIMASVPAAVNTYVTTNYGVSISSGEWIINPLGTNKSFSNPSRALDTAFMPSSTLDTLGVYSVSLACSLSLTGGQSSSTTLEYADDSAFTTNVKTVSVISNGNTGSLTLGLNTSQLYGGVLSGIIPSGKYARTRTSNVTSSCTKNAVNAQEVQLN